MTSAMTKETWDHLVHPIMTLAAQQNAVVQYAAALGRAWPCNVMYILRARYAEEDDPKPKSLREELS